MTYYADLGTETMVAAGSHVRAIGWLSVDEPFPTGDVPVEFTTKLDKITSLWSASTNALGFGVFCGLHTCEFCRQFMSYGNFGIPSGSLLYVAPEMITHYVQEHDYQPPDEFVAAVLACPLPDTSEYEQLGNPFRELQDDWDKDQWDLSVQRAADWARQNGGNAAASDAASRYLGNSCDVYVEQILKKI